MNSEKQNKPADEKKNTLNATAQTAVFNLIILDESGSMSDVTKQTISGCNETLNTVRAAAERYPNLKQFVSIYAFQGGTNIPSRYLLCNEPIDKVKNITDKDYRPWGNTPLLDAVGKTLTDLKMVAATHTDATGMITIITDGYENASTQYTWDQVASLISQFEELGWTVSLIGANIDVKEMSGKMKISNSMAFEQTAEGTKHMHDVRNKAMACRMAEYDEESRISNAEERLKLKKSRMKKFFNK